MSKRSSICSFAFALVIILVSEVRWSRSLESSLTISCSTEGDTRLTGGQSLMDGRVEICLNGCWTRVCYNSSWETREERVLCRQLGYLEYTNYERYQTLGSGGSPTSNRFEMHHIECNGFEERLVQCSHQLDPIIVPSSCDVVGARCLHGVPPQDVQLHSRGESSVTLSWSRPDPSRVQNRIPALTHSNYTITCSARDSHMVQVTHKVTISQQSRNVTITGLDLTASDYHCCVAADYRQNGYSPKSCVNTSSTTDDMITNINTTDHEGNASNTSSTSVSTDIVPSSPLTSTTGSSSPLTSATGLSSLPAVGGALFAAAIVVLLVTLGTCGGIIVHMKWKANRKRMNSSARRASVANNYRHLQPLQNHTTSSEQEQQHMDSPPSGPSGREQHGYEEVDLHAMTAPDGGEQYEVHTTAFGDVSRSCLGKSGVSSRKPNGERPSSKTKQPTQAYYESVDDVPTLKLSTPLENDTLKYKDAELMSDVSLESRTNTSAYSADATEQLPKASIKMLSKRYEFANVKEEASCHSLDSPENGLSEREYVCIDPTAETSPPKKHVTEQHCDYSHVDLEDTSSSSHSYSHINITERDRKNTYVQYHHASTPTIDTSHSYSHINTLELGNKQLSPGYLHLDVANDTTMKVDASPVARGNISKTLESGTSANGMEKSEKGYSHLQVEPDKVPRTLTASNRYTNVEITKLERKEPKAGEQSSEGHLEPRVITEGYSHLNVDEMESEGLKLNPQTTASGYSHLNVDEVESEGLKPKPRMTAEGYSHLNVDEIKSVEESSKQEQQTSSGYSHLEIMENQDTAAT